jgi:carbonic anhydrase
MVLGHSNCGAVQAAIDVANDGAELPGHLPSLTTAIKPAVEAAMAGSPSDLLAAVTAENVRMNVAYLQTAAPILSDLVGSGKVKVVGAEYELATGMVKAVV